MINIQELTICNRLRLGIKMYGYYKFIRGWHTESALLRYPEGHLKYLDTMFVPKFIIKIN